MKLEKSTSGDRKFFLLFLVMLLHSSSSFAADDGSGFNEDDLSDFLTDDVDDVIIKCYVCPNASSAQSDCNLTSLSQRPSDYITECSGHCMNISTENNIVLACTEDVPVRSSKCFTNGGTTMCTCSSDLCNGFPQPVKGRLMNILITQAGDNVTSYPSRTTVDTFEQFVRDRSAHLALDSQIILHLVWLCNVFKIINTFI